MDLIWPEVVVDLALLQVGSHAGARAGLALRHRPLQAELVCKALLVVPAPEAVAHQRLAGPAIYGRGDVIDDAVGGQNALVEAMARLLLYAVVLQGQAT